MVNGINIQKISGFHKQIHEKRKKKKLSVSWTHSVMLCGLYFNYRKINS